MKPRPGRALRRRPRTRPDAGALVWHPAIMDDALELAGLWDITYLVAITFLLDNIDAMALGRIR